MQCPRCGEWSVAITKPGQRVCLHCGWTRPVEWKRGYPEPQVFCSQCQKYTDTSITRVHSQFRGCVECGQLNPVAER